MQAGVDPIHSGLAASSLRSLVQEARAPVAFLPALGRPAVLRVWATSARRAHVAIATSVVCLLLVFPPSLRAILETVYPPKTTTGVRIPFVEKTVGAKTTPDPRLESRHRVLIH